MGAEDKGSPDISQNISQIETSRARMERHRLIAHLGRTFTRRYDIDVLPSGQKGLWACSLDPKVLPEIEKYIEGEKENLDDLPPESFLPKQILYDEKGAEEMGMREINTVLRHEAGHAKYTDFKSMFEGQRQAKDEGNLPTSFWLTWEGIEDPRINNLEGEESPTIDKQIKSVQNEKLKKRLTETPLKNRPQMLQFAYDSYYRWLHGEGIAELKDTEVGKIGDAAQPLLQQYFENTDPEQRKLLQKQIWNLAKPLEEKDIKDEKKRQMARKMGKKNKSGQGQGQGQGQGEGQSQEGNGGEGQQGGFPSIPGGSEKGSESGQSQSGGGKGLLDKLKNTFSKQKKESSKPQQQNESQKNSGKHKEEKIDLSQLSKEELQEISDAIDKLTLQEREELSKKAREEIDQMQKEALEERMPKWMKLEKNKKTGEYEMKPKTCSEKEKEQGKEEFEKAAEKVDREDEQQQAREEEERRLQEEILAKLSLKRQEEMEMEKAGFDPKDREKFLLYQDLENSMYSQVRIFRQAIEKVIPRKKEGIYEGGFFSGPKFDKRDLVRKAPLGNEQFHMREMERPTGEPRLFVGLVVDNSGSMAGHKMEETRKTVIFFAKVCRDMGIPFMVSAFGSNAEVIKQFKQDFDNPAEKIKPKIIDSTNASAPSTNLYSGIEVTIKAMNEERRRLRDSHGLIFVITDGGANAGLTGQELINYIEENRGRLTFKSFGFPGTETFLNQCFGESNCVYPKGFEDLPGEAFRLLRTTLIQFQRYLH